MMPPNHAGRALSEARLQAVLKLVPAIQVFSLIDAVLLSWYFWTEAGPLFLVSWSLVVFAHGVGWWLFAVKTDTSAPFRWRWMVFHAATEGMIFSAFAIVVFPLIPPEKAVVLGAFVMGLLAAGALSKMSIKSAAIVFIVCLSVGSGVGLLFSPLPSPWVVELLLAAFAMALSTLVFGMSEIFDARVTAELELGRQKTLAADLWNDFSESTNEGLWETDAEGKLTLVTPRLAALFGGEPEALTGRTLTSRKNWNTLIERGAAFRNVEVEFGPGRWWSLTGKPLKEGARLLGWRGVASDVTAQRQSELEILRLHRYDSLTGLLNRRSFRTMIDEFFVSPPPALRCLALIDLVDFKDVNESRGHTFGDALLVAVADRLREMLPDRLVVARLDGDEFALQGAVPESSAHSILNLQRLLERLSEPYFVLGERFEASFSLGVSFTNDASSPDQWLRCSDLALRSAKSLGRNHIQVYAPAMMETFLERNRLREDLRGALAREEFFLEYQPLVDLGEGRITGFEALVRWNHPTRGLIAPSQFIPLAEESEVILELGLWVLKKACQTALRWPDDVSLSVNVSGVQLRTGTLAGQVSELLDELGFRAGRLVLEVTESALIRSDGSLARTFAVLKAEGVHWALDDFGTGYSSLSYLQDFPFDRLKIDQSFVRPLSSGGSAALLGSIVALAQTLGLTTTAEGIEDAAQRDVLRALGCEYGQGYFFSKARTAAEVPEMLALAF